MGALKYLSVGKITLFNSLVYFWDWLAGSLFIGLIIFIFINLWQAVYAGGSGLIEGYTIYMMVWYLVLTESIVVSSPKIMMEIGDDIQSGNIAQKLNKPYNYLVFKYFESIASAVLRFFITIGVASAVTLIFLGGFDINVKTLPLVAITVFLALTLNFVIKMLLGVLVFWLEDAKSLRFVYQKIVFVLGGMLLPLELFPDWLAKISMWLPFSYIAYYPARLWVMWDWNFFLEVVIKQIAWIAGMLILTALVYNYCMKKISINGG